MKWFHCFHSFTLSSSLKLDVPTLPLLFKSWLLFGFTCFMALAFCLITGTDKGFDDSLKSLLRWEKSGKQAGGWNRGTAKVGTIQTVSICYHQNIFFLHSSAVSGICQARTEVTSEEFYEGLVFSNSAVTDPDHWKLVPNSWKTSGENLMEFREAWLQLHRE